MPTLAEIDEALRHATSIPTDERGDVGNAYVDSLLEQRRIAMLEDAFAR